MDDRLAFTGFVALIALHRLVELRESADQGSRLGPASTPASWSSEVALLGMHAAYFIALMAELWILRPPLIPVLAWSAAVCFALCALLRIWTLRTFGTGWTMQILHSGADGRARGGPFRLGPYPYVTALGGELLALPLIHGCWRTAFGFPLLYLVLWRRGRGNPRNRQK